MKRGNDPPGELVAAGPGGSERRNRPFQPASSWGELLSMRKLSNKQKAAVAELPRGRVDYVTAL
jgi:hypothetical protein